MNFFIKIAVATCSVLLMFVLSCGGSSTSNTANNVNADSQAIAVSMMGSGVSSSEGVVSDTGTDSQGIVHSISMSPNKTKGIINLVAARAINRAKVLAASPTKTVTTSDDFSSFVFEDETVTNPSGGEAVLNGTLSDTVTEDSSTFRLELNGDLSAELNSWASAVSLDSHTYSETLTGTLTLSFDGYVEVKDEGNDTTVTANINSDVTSSDMNIDGTVNGSGNLNMTVTISGDATSDDNLSSGCSGTATVTTSAHGSETCNVADDCSGCS